MSTKAATWVLACIVFVFAFGSRDAHADPVVGETSIRVGVGKTVSLDVGFARGLVCDDVTIIHAELRGDTPTSNRLVITGVRRGNTQCRAGTSAPTVLVHITVE